MRKKLLSLALALAMCLSLAVPASAANFTDVDDGDYYAGPVVWALEKGITTGTSTTTFSPGETCTVAQILTFLYRASGSPLVNTGNPFIDVNVSDYYYNAALWAYQNGLVSGSVFGPAAPCTRSMVVTYLWKLAGSPAVDVPAASTPDYAPYTISGTLQTWDNKPLNCNIDFAAAIVKETKVALHNDRIWVDIYGEEGERTAHWERDEEGTETDVTLVIILPGSKAKVSGGYSSLTSGDDVIDCRDYHIDRDGNLREIQWSSEGGGYEGGIFGGVYFELFYEDDFEFSDMFGCDAAFAGSLISLDNRDYLVVRADAAEYAGLLGADTGGSFSDVPSSAAYAQAVAWAVNEGITTGTSGSTFSPDGICTRGEIVTFLYRALG